MENKCNKTPNSHNNNNSGKYLDHVYCHTNESKSYIRAQHNNNSNNVNSIGSIGGGGGGGGGAATTQADMFALRKENKQLKAMLILHLDLIQEQSEQMVAKDKQLVTQAEELELSRTKNIHLEAQLQELQKQLQRQIKRAAAAAGELSSLPPPPLAKIQCISDLSSSAAATATVATTAATNNIIGECNGKLISKIILHRVSIPESSPNSATASDTTASDLDIDKTQTIEVRNRQHDEEEEEYVEEEHDEAYDDDDDVQKEEEEEIEEHENEAGETTAGTSTEDSNDALSTHSKRMRCHKSSTKAPISRGAKPRPRSMLAATAPATTPAPTSSSSTTTAGNMQVCITPSTPSRGKQMPLMLWHAPYMHSDESGSCDSLADGEMRSTSLTSPTSPKHSGVEVRKTRSRTVASGRVRPHHQLDKSDHHRHNRRRLAHISTPEIYCSREWEDEEFNCDYEFIKEEANALYDDAPMLEIPKWTEHELSISYSIEGTEDLRDDTFLKRHAKLEVDEKRRKKWDVQQIREQRRIEKLKRRHCKDEIQQPAEQQTLATFYPQVDDVQRINFVNDLPVQAFGEMIPKLPNPNAEFHLPWLEISTAASAILTSPLSAPSKSLLSVCTMSHGLNLSQSSAMQNPNQMVNSSFVFLKKRKRQQSSSIGVGASSSSSIATTRQRASAVAAKAAIQTVMNPSAASAVITENSK